MSLVIDALRMVAKDNERLEVGRLAVESALIELRDERISMPMRGNGLVVRESDGKASHVIRIGTEDALRIALKAIADHIEKEQSQ